MRQLLLLLGLLLVNSNIFSATLIDNLYYNLNSTKLTAEVTYHYSDYTNLDYVTGDLNIPKTVNYGGKNYTVTSIGDKAFYYCRSLTSVSIPNSVTSIGDQAFSFCGLTSLTIPNSVTSIGESAFSYYNKISELIIPPSVTSIGNFAFNNCSELVTLIIQPTDKPLSLGGGNIFSSSGVETIYLGRDINNKFYGVTSLKKVVIDYEVTTLPYMVFSGCTTLEEVEMPDPKFGDPKLKTIEGSAFSGCSSLTSITFPNTVETVGSLAFWNCTALQSVGLSIKQTEIALSTFKGCSALAEITLPNGITSIGNSAFNNCSSLTTINIPEGVTSIGDLAFQGCTLLNNITLPGKIASIGDYAFDGCASLSQIALPDAVTTLGSYSFRDCMSLTSAVLSTELTAIPAYVFSGCTTLPAIFIPEKVISIGDYAFDGCTSLKEAVTSPILERVGTNAFNNCDLSAIMLPATVTDLGAGAFDGNDNLLEVYTLNTTPPVCANVNAFSDNTKANAKLYIPGTAYSLYRSSYCWKDFTLANFEPLNAITSIEIEAPADRLRINKTMALNAVVAPDNATFTDVAWSSSNPNVATVDDSGTVTAVSTGYTVITAKSKSLFAVEGTFELQVIDFLIGDSNESDYVTVTDAVNIASYVMGNEPDVFNFDASDVNESGDITLADASGVITIVLDDANIIADNNSYKAPASYDYNLVAPELNFLYDEKVSIPIRLESITPFIAMQADVKVNGGLSIASVKASEALSASHLMMTKRISDDAMRVVIYSPGLNELPTDVASLFEVNIKGNSVEGASLVITNKLATGTDLNEYSLGFEGGNIENASNGVTDIEDSEFTIETGAGIITVSGASGKTIRIYTSIGALSALKQHADEIETFYLVPGVYVVTVDNKAQKVTIR